MIQSHTRRTFLLSAGSAALLSACGNGENARQSRSATAASGVVYNHGNGAEPASLDPHHTQEAYAASIIGDLIVGLTTEDVDGNVIPGAAERWSRSEDGKSWTFYLRDHVWSDGQPVTADDFVYAWRRILDPKTAASYAYVVRSQKCAGSQHRQDAGKRAWSYGEGPRDTGCRVGASRPVHAPADDAHDNLSPAAPCCCGEGRHLDETGFLCGERAVHPYGMGSE